MQKYGERERVFSIKSPLPGLCAIYCAQTHPGRVKALPLRAFLFHISSHLVQINSDSAAIRITNGIAVFALARVCHRRLCW